ncbi:unnamed protein product [Brachionus calyciflorus]|uniref:POP1 n=1 Tax=Brachionus calyciflorus TaxID=104777 RepID=A0A813M4S0_9BILA|nr:unnamed protein product [Brachionus calyciflorus]
MDTSEDKDLTHEVDVAKFASFRRKEIELLSNEAFLSKENKQKSLFQLLPRHMRRRTMGYIRKRLPHRIRKQAQIKPPNKKNKRPSRKFRRRPSNLRSEYERRKRLENNMWLETHIWHAKRFHMANLYGYRLALHDNVKGKRNVFKGLKNFCCLHDESYYVCHELIGEENQLVQGLNRLCSQETGLTFGAKITITGKCEGRTILYEIDQYPYNCIGPCRFIWKPGQNENRILWVWTHPSIFKKFENELIKLFGLESDQEESPVAKKRKLGSDHELNCWKSNNIKLKCLKDELVRFKLLGPLSTPILGNVLRTIPSRNFEKQTEIWNNIKSSIKDPNEVCPSTILGLLVKDPRLVLPKKKSFNKINENYKLPKNGLDEENQKIIRSEILSSDLPWDKDYVKNLNSTKKSTFEINKIRSDYLVPGTDLTKIEMHSQIPVLVVQNCLITNFNGIKYGGLYSGWDLILPKSWAMDFWMTLVHFGCKAIGQNEMNYLLFESGNFQFPNEYHDTEAGQLENESKKIKLFEKFRSRPPSKRVNYFKNGIMSPFYLPWKSILELNLNSNTQTFDLENQKFYILRNKKILLKLSGMLFNKNKQLKLSLDLNEDEIKKLELSYIGVRLESIGRGTLDQFSILYDYFDLKDQKEELDENDSELLHLRLVSNKLIDEYREEFIQKSDLKQDDLKSFNKLLRSKFNKFEMLKDEKWFIKHSFEYRDSKFYKQPIGFICSNGFSLVSGKCSANGFILTKHLLNLIQNTDKKMKNIQVNYKEPNSPIYRTAKINQFFI